MSRITTIIDAFRTRIAIVLSDHKQLRFNRLIEDNDDLFLVKGYAIRPSIGDNTNRVLSCKLSIRRELEVTITRAVFGTDRDVTKRNDNEKALLEDQFLVIKDFEKDPTISGVTAKMFYLSDNGIEEIFTNQGHYLMIQSTFEFEYLEDLT